MRLVQYYTNSNSTAQLGIETDKGILNANLLSEHFNSDKQFTMESILKEQTEQLSQLSEWIETLNSTNNNVNNLYKGSKHYVAPENGPTPGINWIRQWFTLADWYPDIKFIKVNRYNDGRDDVNGPIEKWESRKNIVYADYSTLDNLV